MSLPSEDELLRAKRTTMRTPARVPTRRSLSLSTCATGRDATGRHGVDIGAGCMVVNMTIRNGVRIMFKNGPPTPFHYQGVSMGDATPDQLRFMNSELARFLASGAWEEGHCSRWISRLFLAPKPGVNKWRLIIIDLQPLNRYCEERDLSFETLTRLRHMARPGDYMMSMDLHDGRAQFLFLAIRPAQLLLRELHDVLRTKDSWSGLVKMTHQLRRDLERWVAVPSHSNGRSIYKPVETAYMYVDSSGYGWGAVLSETTEARGF
eukprot:jgi/Tetstr1/438577/TSEL_027128.t1